MWMLGKIFHYLLILLHPELPNHFYPRRIMRDLLSVNSLSFLLMRFNIFQYSRCFILATGKLWSDLPSMIVEVVELQQF